MPKIPKILIRAIITDKKGNVIKTLPRKQARSLIKAFIYLLKIQMSQVQETIKDTTGIDRPTQSNSLNLAANSNTSSFGIVIGSGTTPPTITDNKLQTQLTTNVTHSLMAFALDTPNPNTITLDLIRTFSNLTGSTLNIREVGLYLQGVSYYFCADRTLYSVDVPAGNNITITYRFIVTV
jgi:hypothetical protein